MVIDALLRLIEAQRAASLVVPSTQPPYLVKAGERKPLSMPPLGPEMVALVIEELATPDQRTSLERSQRVEISYDLEGQTYSVLVEHREHGLQVEFRPASANAAPSSAMPENVEPAIAPSSPPPPVAGALAAILQEAVQSGASDVFLSSGQMPMLRVGDRLRLVGGNDALASLDVRDALSPWLEEADRARFDSEGHVDFSIPSSPEVAGLRWRANLFRQQRGFGAALRPIRANPPTLAELNLSEELYELTRFRNGLVLMAGSTGSGKSTTLVALIERLNRNEPRHVITLEDPIEYEYRPQRALIHQRELGRDVRGFADGLRAAMRESPDVILLGEMRDRETIAAALTAAETGHLVLSTIHSGSAVMAIERILNAFPEHRHGQIQAQLASTLRAVVTQTLLPSRTPPRRVPAIELLRVSLPVAAKIREGRLHQLQSEIQTGKASGMISFEASLASLVRAGLVSEATAREATMDRAALELHLR